MKSKRMRMEWGKRMRDAKQRCIAYRKWEKDIGIEEMIAYQKILNERR